MPANSIFDDPITNLLKYTVHFDRNLFTWGGSLTDLKSGTCMGHFASEGEASKAVKG